MISGKLPNESVWWLSTDGLKIWIESRDLEQEKFKEKVYNIVHGRIFHARKEVGELTKSRLDSRRGKDAWIIKLDAMLDIYPELSEEIRKKSIEEAKKKKTHKKRKMDPVKIEPPRILEENVVKLEENVVKLEENVKRSEKEEQVEKIKDTLPKEAGTIEAKGKVTDDTKKEIKDLFDINRPYTVWIKDEINKSETGKIVLPTKELKEKMGPEFINMHDLRIYFGLKKILSSIGLSVELKSSKSESVIVIRKVV